MLGPTDLAQMASDMLAITGDNPESIIIRRGAASLAAQTVRVVRVGAQVSRAKQVGGQAFQAQNGAAMESTSRVLVMGAVGLNIQIDDRFTVDGILYRVIFVRPNRMAMTVADAEAVE